MARICDCSQLSRRRNYAVCDVSHRILRTETCYDILADLHQMHRSNFKNMAVRALVGCIVLTRYNNKSYRIDDIIFNQNPRSTFTNYKGEEISYMDYYFNTYGIKIKDLHQPLLLHPGRKKDVARKKNYSHRSTETYTAGVLLQAQYFCPTCLNSRHSRDSPAQLCSQDKSSARISSCQLFLGFIWWSSQHPNKPRVRPVLMPGSDAVSRQKTQTWAW
nr:piwi-like protein 2 [Cherax quadricarinatus]